MEKKITLKYFWESNENLAIHCNTKEKADRLLNAFDKMGKKWRNGNSYIKNNCWKEYGPYTCYSNYGTYGQRSDFVLEKSIIYKFEDIDLENNENKTMINLFQEMKNFADNFFEKAKAMLGINEEIPKETKEETIKEKTWQFSEKQKDFLQMLDKKWNYIVRDRNSEFIHLYKNYPRKEEKEGYWVGNGYDSWSLTDDLFKNFKFDNIQWEDEMPCEFKKYIGEEDDE